LPKVKNCPYGENSLNVVTLNFLYYVLSMMHKSQTKSQDVVGSPLSHQLLLPFPGTGELETFFSELEKKKCRSSHRLTLQIDGKR
jgi:hypothetical protein